MSKTYDIMLVEDDENLAYLLSEQLKEQEFNVKVCSNGNQAIKRFEKESVDLLILDIVLPDMDGISLAKSLKAINDQVPFVFLTSRNLKSDQLLGFEIGADDYITKPFDTDLLIMRLNVILNRIYGEEQVSESTKPMEYGNCTLEVVRKRLKTPKQEIKLSSTECGILTTLIKAGGDPVSRDQIMIDVWGKSDFFISKSLDVYLSRIRKMLAECDLTLETIHGFGYALVVA